MSRRRSDLWVVSTATLLCFVVSSQFQLQESFVRRLASFERWQADELPFTMTVFALGLAWYGWRRRNETLVELRLRQRAETRVGELLAHNRQLAQRLIAAHETERLSLARELHDELGQRCTAIRAEAAYIRGCATEDHAAIRAAAARADAAAALLYAGVRDLLKRLRPADLDALGLVAAVQELCSTWADQTGLACTFVQHAGPVPVPLDDATEIAVYRVAQEALTNVVRHSQARSAQVELQLADGSDDRHSTLALTVSDDGIGMDALQRTHGLGLLGAAERAAALGGTLDLDTSPGAGLRLRLILPLTTDLQATQPGIAAQ